MMLITILVSLWQKSSLKGELIIIFCTMAEIPPTATVDSSSRADSVGFDT